MSNSLCGCKTWSIREHDNSRIMLAEVKFMRRIAKYTWQAYRTNVDILSELKINPVIEKMQNYRNKWIQVIRRSDRDRRSHLIFKYRPARYEAKEEPSEDFSIGNGNGTGLEA